MLGRHRHCTCHRGLSFSTKAGSAAVVAAVLAGAMGAHQAVDHHHHRSLTAAMPTAPSGHSPSGHSPSGAERKAVREILAYAHHQLGKPYIWGGAGPGGFDCSGLVMMAYRAAGAGIPRTSQQQWAWGPWVKPGHERPGDLVFFAGSDGTPTSPGHVGLVIGHHEMIQAYMTGTNLMISTYGEPGSLGGLQRTVGFTRPLHHAGVRL